MRSWLTWICVLALVAGAACGDRTPDEDAPATADTTEIGLAPGGGEARGGDGGAPEETPTTTADPPTTAASPAATGAPSPPGGYAVDSRPADDGQLARIEYASPRTVPEVAAFYDSQIRPPRRVELEVAGDNIVVYGLTPGTTVGPATTYVDVERLLDQRSEPIVVISPWTMPRSDPLIGDLREAGQGAQADALLNTRSKVTVVYAVQ